LKIGFEEIEIGTTPHLYSFAVMVGKATECNAKEQNGTWVKRQPINIS